MTKKKQAGATPRQYDAAFTDEAVRMWLGSTIGRVESEIRFLVRKHPLLRVIALRLVSFAAPVYRFARRWTRR